MICRKSRTRGLRAVLLSGAALLVGGCESARFGGRAPVAAIARSAPTSAPSEPVVQTVPSGSVTAEPLPPPPGASGPEPLGRNVAADIPTLPGSPGPVETLGGLPPAPAAVAAAPSRSASVGGWTAREATGSSCRVTLSSTPALDLYRASAGSCANRDLAGVTAWDFRDGEVYLFQPGGAVAARLRPSGGALAGVMAKSGAPLTLSR
jgi:hypothetical protein